MKVILEEKDGIFSYLIIAPISFELADHIMDYANEQGYKHWLPAGPNEEYRFAKEMPKCTSEECDCLRS